MPTVVVIPDLVPHDTQHAQHTRASYHMLTHHPMPSFRASAPFLSTVPSLIASHRSLVPSPSSHFHLFTSSRPGTESLHSPALPSVPPRFSTTKLWTTIALSFLPLVISCVATKCKSDLPSGHVNEWTRNVDHDCLAMCVVKRRERSGPHVILAYWSKFVVQCGVSLSTRVLCGSILPRPRR